MWLLLHLQDHFKYISEDEDSQVNGSLPSLLAKGEKFSKQLETFHGKIHTLVNDWMNYYCEKMGIDKPDSPSSRPASRAGGAQRGYSSYQGRLVKSSMSYATGSHLYQWVHSKKTVLVCRYVTSSFHSEVTPHPLLDTPSCLPPKFPCCQSPCSLQV